MILTGKGGKQYNLEPAPFAQGGEGEIYNVIGQPQIVAKLYKQGKITIEHERKLVTMMSTPPNANVMTQIAWPQDVLYKQGVFVGFIMQKFKLNEDLNVIYEYGSAAKYPDMPWGNKINIAKNICVVVDEVHNSGHIIGDFNPRNINVDPTSGLVVFVDTDSYHIKDGNNVYRCNVGLPEYLAKEIQVKMNGKESLSTCALPTFSQATDKFALAIHIFQLLMNGVHPFACAVLPSQSSVAFPQPTDNILNGQCAFLQNVPGITIPAYAPSIDILPSYMKDLFKRAFVDGHTNPSARPSAEEWYNALDKLQRNLKKCTTVSYHQYEASLSVCPWCAANAKFSRSTSRGGMQTSMGYTPGSGSGGGSRPPMPPQPPRPPQPPKPPTGSGTNSGGSSGGSTPTPAPKKKNKGCGCLIAVLIVLGIIGIAIMSNWDSIMDLVDGGNNYVDNTCYYHSYGSWVVEKEATEERTGLRVKTCYDCGYRQEETIPKLDHTHNYSDWVVEKKATEESTGLRVQTCSKCGDRIEETIAKLDHVHIPASISAISATCSSLGKTEGSYCSKCNEVLTAQKDVPMDHSFSNGVCKYCGTTDMPSTGLTMQLNSDKKSYSVTGVGSCTDNKIVIPMTYDGLQVTQIGNSAFANCDNITEVVTSKSIIKIGDKAFATCKRLESIILDEGLTNIGAAAFYNCISLTSIDIPASVQTIANTTSSKIDGAYRGVFEGCTALKKAVIGDESTNATRTTIGTEAFQGCTALAEVYIGNSVKSIGECAFNNTAVSKLTLGNSVENIDYAAFYACVQLESVIIPDSVKTIGNQAFLGCTRLKSVHIGQGVTTIGAAAFYNCISLEEILIPSNVKTIANETSSKIDGAYRGVFEGCVALTKIIIGDEKTSSTLTTIGTEAFQGCTSVKEIYIGNAVKSIGERAFNNTGVEKLTIGNNVTNIDHSAFYWNPYLTSVIIPDSVTSIGGEAFTHCTRLESIIFGKGLKSIGAAAFYNCISLKEVNIPANVKTIANETSSKIDGEYRGVFEGCTSLTKVVIGDDQKDVDLTSIGSEAFQGCGAIKEVYIGNAVGSIGDRAFNDIGAETITIGNSVKTIGYAAFYSCNNLKSVVIPDSVTSIGERAFTYCNGMTSISFGKGLKSIGAAAFYSCSSLKEVNIPANVKTIANETSSKIDGEYRGVFEGCTSLTKVVIGDDQKDVDLTSIGSEAFQGCGAITEIFIGNSVGNIGDRAFNNTGVEQLTIGDSVKSIGVSAFYWSPKLTTLIIPNSVQTIGEKAFAFCDGLLTLSIGNSVTSIGAAAFYHCVSLTEVQIPSNVKTIANRTSSKLDGDYRGAFEGCTSLKKVTIGDNSSSVTKTTIGSEAFQGCTSLESITIGRTVGTLGDNSFKDCTKLSTLYYLGSETEWKAVTQGNNWYNNTGITKVTYVQ